MDVAMLNELARGLTIFVLVFWARLALAPYDWWPDGHRFD